MADKISIPELLLKRARLIFFGLNAEGIITLANTHARHLLGFDYHEMEGHSLADLLGEPLPRGIDFFLLEAQSEAQILKIRCRNGEQITTLGTVALLEESPTPLLKFAAYLTPIPKRDFQPVPTPLPLSPLAAIAEPFPPSLASHPATLLKGSPDPVTPATPPVMDRGTDWFWSEKLNFLKLEPLLPFKFRFQDQMRGLGSGDMINFATTTTGPSPRENSDLERLMRNAIPDSSPTKPSESSEEIHPFRRESKRLLFQLLFFIEKELEKISQNIGLKNQYLMSATDRFNDPITREMKNAIKGIFVSLRALKRVEASLSRVVFTEDTARRSALPFEDLFGKVMVAVDNEVNLKTIKIINNSENFIFVGNEQEALFIFTSLLELVVTFTREGGSISISLDKSGGRRELYLTSPSHFFENQSSLFEQMLIDRKLEFLLTSLMCLGYGITIEQGILDGAFFIKLIIPEI